MVLTDTDIVKYQYRTAAPTPPNPSEGTLMLSHHPLVAMTLQERERELEAWSLGRLASRIRDCCRPGRLARLATRVAAMVRPQGCCVEGASA
jgi:hypothetical protein